MQAQSTLPRRRFTPSIVLLLPMTGLVIASWGCAKSDKPRSIEEINADRLSLPSPYQTPSGKMIKAAANQGMVFDEATKEIAWPVYECTNPECPGRSAEGEPHLFIWTDPRFYVNDQGQVGERDFQTIEDWRKAVKESGGHREPTCEPCLEIRDKSRETPEETLEFSMFVQKHVLPETVVRQKELDAEHQRRIEYINKKIGTSEE